ncbi:NAD(P)-dependent oxidoreductase [Paenibacillus sp. CF384]|uniref:NAD(P)-dependent oxidoreductase n=1 Tax=Paenibacillus sp. CF384 TaxID=1884382 RepID=UPI0008943A09|nr:NAD(P)-dependent oxidoreductase [Paenibacillus sp. CF384]SDY01164.1 D-3-phosphoglycerate dehydrogenase [Paenibacillus sp. CF384]
MATFQLGLTRDFLNSRGEPAFGTEGIERISRQNHIQPSYFDEHLNTVTAEQLQHYDGVISLTPRYTAEALSAAADRLIVIARYGVGYDMVDVQACTEADIAVTITPQGIRKPVAYAIMTHMLALAHRLPVKSRLIAEKRWQDRIDYPGYRITGQTLGSVGFGNIAKELFRMTRGFEMTSIAYDPYADPAVAASYGVELVDLQTLCESSDYLTINCFLSKETFHLISYDQLRAMKRSAFLINTARGGIVDEQALVSALQEGWISGAGLDVFEEEPFVSDSPLLHMDNVIVTPHSLCWTEEMVGGLWADTTNAIMDVASGSAPANVVNREVLARPGFIRKLERFSTIERG